MFDWGVNINSIEKYRCYLKCFVTIKWCFILSLEHFHSFFSLFLSTILTYLDKNVHAYFHRERITLAMIKFTLILTTDWIALHTIEEWYGENGLGKREKNEIIEIICASCVSVAVNVCVRAFLSGSFSLGNSISIDVIARDGFFQTYPDYIWLHL